MPYFFDRLEVELPPLTLAEIGGADQGPTPSLWSRLAARPSPKPALSPWGEVADAREIAPGIMWFATQTRSGYQLSPSRQKALPRYLRTEDRWYEDTTEWAAVAVVFDRIFDRMPSGAATGHQSLYEIGKETLRQWKPEEYESWFQTTLDPDEIWSLAVMQFHRLRADHWIVIDVFDDRHAFVPAGHLHARAKRGGDPPYSAEAGGAKALSRWFRVHAHEFTHRRGRPFHIDPVKHPEIDEPNCAARFLDANHTEFGEAFAM